MTKTEILQAISEAINIIDKNDLSVNGLSDRLFEAITEIEENYRPVKNTEEV